MEITQVFLAAAAIILAAMLGVIFTQVYFILKDLRVTVNKLNQVLDDTSLISGAVSRPVNMLSTFLLGLKGGSKILKFLTKQPKKEDN